MRIRNSQPACPFPHMPPEAVLRSTYLHSHVEHFDERFLVEEANRPIGWPCCPSTEHSNPGIQREQLHPGLNPAIASELNPLNFAKNKIRKEESVLPMESQVSQKIEEHWSGRASNFSAASGRDGKGPGCSGGIVLALRAPSCQPVHHRKSFGAASEKQLPLKKRIKCRSMKYGRKSARKEEAGKEVFIEYDCNRWKTRIKCSKIESQLPWSGVDGPSGSRRDEAVILEGTAMFDEEKPKRKMGRPRKVTVHLPSGTSGMGKGNAMECKRTSGCEC